MESPTPTLCFVWFCWTEELHQETDYHGLSISQSIKIHLKMSCQYRLSDLYCDITLCFEIKIDSQLGLILAFCEISPSIVGYYYNKNLTVWVLCHNMVFDFSMRKNSRNTLESVGGFCPFKGTHQQLFVFNFVLFYANSPQKGWKPLLVITRGYQKKVFLKMKITGVS